MFITALASLVQWEGRKLVLELVARPFYSLFISYCVKLYVFVYICKKNIGGSNKFKLSSKRTPTAIVIDNLHDK